MASSPGVARFRNAVAAELPRMRRFARAATGDQRAGDVIVSAALEAVEQDPPQPDARTAMLHAFARIWQSLGAPVASDLRDLSNREAENQVRLARLTPRPRLALLMHTLGDATVAQIAHALRLNEAATRALIEEAWTELRSAQPVTVLVIEDEPLTALEERSIIGDMGHVMVGIARTRDAAVALAARHRPEVVVADIRLGDGSSGIDATETILDNLARTQVIFVTGQADRLLTGAAREPAFVIPKPFTEDALRSAIAQAAFFARKDIRRPFP